MRARKNRSSARGGPQPVGNIISELMMRKGFAQVRGAEAVENAWRQAVGEPAARYTCPGRIRRGVLDVAVANSTIIQELLFQKSELLLSLKRLLPDTRIQDLRFHVATVDEKKKDKK